MTLSEEVIAKLNETLKKSSVKRYKAWSNIVSPKEYNLDEFINFHKLITEEFKTRVDYTSILIVIIRVLTIEGKPTDIYEDLRKTAMNSKNIFSTPNNQDKERAVTVEEIYIRRQELLHKFMEDPSNKSNAYQLQYLYMITELSPFRTQDYVGVGFSGTGDSATTENYVDMDARTIKYNVGKSQNSIRTVNIPEDVYDIIEKNKNRFNAEYLFPSFTFTKKSVTSSGFVSLVRGIFDKDITPQLMRQIFVSHMNDTNVGKKERVAKASEMGHTYQTSQTQYTKLSKIIHEKDKLVAEQKNIIDTLYKRILYMEDETKNCTC